MKEYKYKDITKLIIGSAYTVHDKLESGFLEKIYANSLAIELINSGLKVKVEYPIQVKYHNYVVGDYIADLIVEDKVIVEIKAVKELIEIHEVQLVNYLKATGIEVGLLINFGNSVEIKRKIIKNISK